MAAKQEEEDGWPLGLQPLNNNARVVGQLARNADLSGSVTASPTSTTVSSSDLDTESTGSFFHDKSKTLGSLMGASNILDQSKKKSRKARKGESFKERKRSNSRTWIFSLCSKDNSTDHAQSIITNNNNPVSLAHFLAVERKAASECRRNQNLSNSSSCTIYGIGGWD